MGEGDDDPDREAILARRRKFIAVALAGLTSAAGCGDDAAPEACLNMRDPGATLEPVGETEEERGQEEATPDEQAEETGSVEEGTDETTDEDEASDEPSAASSSTRTKPDPDRARPRVCLRRAAPRPPRKQRPEPLPCLMVLEHKQGDDDA